MDRKNSFYIVAILVFIFGLYLAVPAFNPVDATSTTQSSQISYQGQEGVTALELLKNTHQVETASYDFGEMVNSIDGVKPGENQFWSFYINGEMATEGADTYVTKSSDTLSWKLDNIQ